MAENQHNAGDSASESDDEKRVEFWRDSDGPLIDAEAFLTAFAVNLYEPEPGKPNEPARILAAEAFWPRARAVRDGGAWDRDVAATQAVEMLRRAVEEAVRAGRLVPRHTDGLKMRNGIRPRDAYAAFVYLCFERPEFLAFARDEAPTIQRGAPVEVGALATPDAAPNVAPASNAAPAEIEAPRPLIGPDSPLWSRKNGKGAAWWTTAELAELLRVHDLLKAQRVRNPTAQLAAALGVSTKTISRHLDAANRVEAPSDHSDD